MQNITRTKQIGNFKGKRIFLDWRDLNINSRNNFTKSFKKNSLIRLILIIDFVLISVTVLFLFLSGFEITDIFQSPILAIAGIIFVSECLLIVTLSSKKISKRDDVQKVTNSSDEIIVNKYLSANSQDLLHSIIDTKIGYLDDTFSKYFLKNNPKMLKRVLQQFGVHKLDEISFPHEMKSKIEWVEEILLNSYKIMKNSKENSISLETLLFAFLKERIN